MILPHGVGEFQPQHLRVELDGLRRILATESGMVKFLAQHGETPDSFSDGKWFNQPRS
jgi:hypothetical protein